MSSDKIEPTCEAMSKISLRLILYETKETIVKIFYLRFDTSCREEVSDSERGE